MSAHGTRSGYMAHHRNGTEACAPCKAAHAKYQRDYRRRLVRLTDEQAEHIRWALRFAKHESEARDNARAEVERLSAQVEAVRALHASSGDEESQGYLPGGGYGFIAPYCTGCVASDEYATAWPCPTIRALDGEQS